MCATMLLGTAIEAAIPTLFGRLVDAVGAGDKARAVLSAAPILILDEATSSLDSVSEHLLQETVDDAARGRTTLIVAHRLSTVQRMDRILLFDGGRIAEQGRHRDLLERPDGLYRRLFETQVLGLVG